MKPDDVDVRLAPVEDSEQPPPPNPRLVFAREMDDSGDEPMQVRHYLDILRRRRWLLLIIVLLGTAPVIYLLANNPNYYDARAQIEVQPETTTDLAEKLAQADPTLLTTELQMITSNIVLKRVVIALRLAEDPAFLAHMPKGGRLMRQLLRMFYIGDPVPPSLEQGLLTPSLAPSSTDAELEEVRQLEPYVAEVRRRLTVEPVKETRTLVRETRLVGISFRHPHHLLAVRVANAVADSYVLSTREYSDQTSRLSNRNLTNRAQQLEAEIREADRKLAVYGAEHEIVSLEAGQNIAFERLATLNRRLIEAENDRKIAEANNETAQDPGAARALAEPNLKPRLAEMEARLAGLRQKRSQLLVTTTEKWPEVRETAEQIAVLEQQISAERNNAIVAVQADSKTTLQKALAQEQSIRELFEQERQSNRTQNLASIGYKLMQQEIETRKRLLDMLLDRIGKDTVKQTASQGNARINDYALTPDPSEPAGPMRLPYVLIAVLLSLCVGIVVAIARDHLDARIRTPQDVKVSLKIPVLGAVESVGRVAAKTISNAPSSKAATNLTEDFRRLRTSLLLQGPDPLRSVLVTSSQPGEGKTTTAVNIALSLAQTGAHVLLIDGDMRRPKVHKMLQLDNTRGLTSLLGRETQEADLADYVQLHSSGVHVLTAGPPSGDSTELLSSGRIRQLLNVLKTAAFDDPRTGKQRRFTRIVIDSVSVSSAPDSLLLSRFTDGVLMVIHSGKVSRDIAKNVIEELRMAGANVLGVVLNNARVPRAPYSVRLRVRRGIGQLT